MALFAIGERLLELALDHVGRAADGSALVRAELAHAADQVGQRALAAEVGDAPLLEGGGVGGARRAAPTAVDAASSRRRCQSVAGLASVSVMDVCCEDLLKGK